ncbi:hypothetical protein [Bacteroides sedimenti]|uniref:Gliding motility lipoprotein GldH n=1 Tax=Bacteroides sedimenti TaxID=2136147 RepID=A0ABM8IAM9_9BACE
MKNTLLYVILIISSCFSSCGFSKYEQKDRNFSISLEESKLHKTYIREYNYIIKANSDSLQIKINHAWLEKACFYRANVFESIDSLNKTLLMDINLNNELYFNKENYGSNWIMEDCATSTFVGSLRDLFGVGYYENESINDKIAIKIHKMTIPHNVNQGLEYIGSIELVPR